MKPSLMPVCFLLLAGITIFGQEKKPELKPAAEGTITSSNLKISGPPALSQITLTSQQQSLIVFDQSDNAEAFRLTGLTAIELGDPSPYQGIRYGRPEKPEDVVACLWTKDGRKWRATWTEVKP